MPMNLKEIHKRPKGLAEAPPLLARTSSVYNNCIRSYATGFQLILATPLLKYFHWRRRDDNNVEETRVDER